MACLSLKAHLSFMPFATFIGLAIPMTDDNHWIWHLSWPLSCFLECQEATRRSSFQYRSRIWAMAITIADLYWIRMLLKDLHVPLVSPPTLWCDNLRALALLQTWFSMLEPNISMLISTSFVKKLLTKIWWFALFQLMIKLLIFLQRVYLLHDS